jgi:hypothetical protein
VANLQGRIKTVQMAITLPSIGEQESLERLQFELMNSNEINIALESVVS